jgi:hypothetical protein
MRADLFGVIVGQGASAAIILDILVMPVFGPPLNEPGTTIFGLDKSYDTYFTYFIVIREILPPQLQRQSKGKTIHTRPASIGRGLDCDPARRIDELVLRASRLR